MVLIPKTRGHSFHFTSPVSIDSTISELLAWQQKNADIASISVIYSKHSMIWYKILTSYRISSNEYKILLALFICMYIIQCHCYINLMGKYWRIASNEWNSSKDSSNFCTGQYHY